jgi:hypothetical protein
MQQTPPEVAGSFDFLATNGRLAMWGGKQGSVEN